VKGLGFLKIFFPLFFIVAVLPFFLILLSKPLQLGFSSQASDKPTLRVWFEPKDVEAQKGSKVSLSIVAEFESQKDILANLTFGVSSTTKSVSISPVSFSYSQPFQGKAQIGDVSITSRSVGDVTVSILEQSLRTNFDRDHVTVVTSPATVHFIE
jgi:hypothetical protein